MVDISVIIPVREEEHNIRELASRLTHTLEAIVPTYEIIFITDLNRDRTFEILREINTNDPRIKTIKFSNSYGQYVAVLAGLGYSKGKAVVLMDGDLQDYPEDIPKLCAKFREGYDVVCGIKEKKNDSAIRNFFSKTFVKLLNSLSDYDLSYNTCMFRIISRRTVEEISKFREREPDLTGIMSLIRFPTAKVLVTSGQRKAGQTKYSFLRQLNLAISVLLSFSTKPLRISSICGFVIASLSLIYLLIIIFQKLFFDITVSGWSTIASLITFLGGIQLFFIGIIGEYVGRIFMETKKRPLYVVEEKIGDFE